MAYSLLVEHMIIVLELHSNDIWNNFIRIYLRFKIELIHATYHLCESQLSSSLLIPGWQQVTCFALLWGILAFPGFWDKIIWLISSECGSIITFMNTCKDFHSTYIERGPCRLKNSILAYILNQKKFVPSDWQRFFLITLWWLTLIYWVLKFTWSNSPFNLESYTY